MSTGDFLSIQPSELKFPFELKKQSSCSMQLTNKMDKYVAFKVKTTNPKKYCVRPNAGVVSPGTSCNVTADPELKLHVTMQAQKDMPSDMQCKDKFLIQCVTAPDGTTAKDVTPEMFNKGDGKVVEECKLRVVYIPANPPSPVPEESEEESSPRASVPEDGGYQNPSFDDGSGFLDEQKDKSSEAWSIISKLTEDKADALQQRQKLRQELELLRNEISKSQARGFSILFLVLVGLIGVLLGFFLKKT